MLIVKPRISRRLKRPLLPRFRSKSALFELAVFCRCFYFFLQYFNLQVIKSHFHYNVQEHKIATTIAAICSKIPSPRSISLRIIKIYSPPPHFVCLFLNLALRQNSLLVIHPVHISPPDTLAFTEVESGGGFSLRTSHAKHTECWLLLLISIRPLSLFNIIIS